MSGYISDSAVGLPSAEVKSGDGRERFGVMLDQLLQERKRGRSWLGAEVARIEGSDEPISGASVSKWVGGNPPAPGRVFAIEEALDIEPGMLSRLLGYLPADARSVTTTADAIAADPALTPLARRALLAAYREFVA